jgi:hypothetical protein
LAPRIFAPNSIFEIANSITTQSFILRFVNEEDKQFALQAMRNLGDGQEFKKWTKKPGSHYPTICFFFDICTTFRALVKLGLNLIAAHCPNTPINRESFPTAVRIVRDEAGQIPPKVLEMNGFVHAADIQPISAAANSHSFRLVHVDSIWHVYSSFFGGRIGSYVRVPGPNLEVWRCADIVAPLGSKDWTIETSRILPYMQRRVEWSDSRLIAPSLKLQNTVSMISVERVQQTRFKANHSST